MVFAKYIKLLKNTKRYYCSQFVDVLDKNRKLKIGSFMTSHFTYQFYNSKLMIKMTF